MAKNNKRRSGDRYDGRRIKNLGELRDILPHYITRRTAAQRRYEERFEVTDALLWIEAQRKAGYEGMSFVHIFIAIFVRCCAYLPILNRFVSGRRLYSHNTVDIVLTVKRSHSVYEGEIPVKLSLDRTDTVFDVYRKLNRVIEKLETEDKLSRTEELAVTLSKRQRILTRLFTWFTKIADYFGFLSPQVIDASPFHGTVTISDNGSMGLSSSYNDLHDFGTVPLSVSLGKIRGAGERSIMDMKFVLDGRICDSDAAASVFSAMQKLLNEPALLEIPPKKIINDET